ncbi:eosinophil cationic protein-like [Hipposideros larvatus]
MVPRQWDFQLCLFLLLGLLGMVISSHGAPGNLTPSQWFYTQHIKMRSRHCNIAMQPINRLIYSAGGTPCKPMNTFLRTNFRAVTRVCNTYNITCPSSHDRNCHRSPYRVQIIHCDLINSSSSYRNCRYRRTKARMTYIVACDRRTPRDNTRARVVPVHLEPLF